MPVPKNANQFLTHLKNVSPAIIEIDLNGKIIFCNETAANLTGIRPGYMKGELYSELKWECIKEDETPLATEDHPAMKTLKTNVTLVNVLTGIKSNGKPLRWYCVNASPVHNPENGNIISVLSSYHDITDLKSISNVMHSTEDFYHNMINAVQEYAILLIDSDGNIKNWNTGAERIKGYKQEEIINKNFRIFYTQKDLDDGLPDRLLYEAAKNGNASDEGWRVRKDGSLFWATVTITALYSNKHTITGFTKITRDMTERKKAAEQILEYEKKYHQAVNSLGDTVWEHDFLTGKTWFSETIFDLLGYRHDEIEDNVFFWRKHIHPDDKWMVDDSDRKYQAGLADSHWMEYRMFCKDGSEKWILDRGKLQEKTADGKPLKIIGSHKDITQRKKDEEDLRQLNRKLTLSNKELEQFAYIASHDLQEPLRMVISFLQLLEKKYAANLDATAFEYIKYAVDGAERMKRLIADLLKFSRLNSSITNEKEIVNCTTLVNDIVKIYKKQTEESNATIKVLPLPVIYANKTQIEQVFQNLIGNALKFKAGTKPAIEIGASENENNFTFFVKDDGIGIDEKYFDKIFTIFQKLHSLTQYDGTGIGLAICKKITELHEGDIWVASEKGKGSTFYFTIAKKKKDEKI